jgi:NAD+ kinase
LSRTAAVLTHRRPEETRPALRALFDCARDAGVTLRFDREETRKLELAPEDGLELDADGLDGLAICFAFGGDGTILTALRMFAGTAVPVFGVNFGEIGFLAAVEREGAQNGFQRALAGDYEVIEMPTLVLAGAVPSALAINDVSIHRHAGNRVASLAYSVGRDEVGSVRCDGLVVATPAGSTGYNLANGGPVMAWGVEGFVVSFIAPHSLTARALVVAPGDVLTVRNGSDDESVDVAIDGRPVATLSAGASLQVRFDGRRALLAQLPGATFYERLREKFGRLATGR